MANSYISLYVHIAFRVGFNRPDGTILLSLFSPAMNRWAIVMQAPPGLQIN